MRNLEDRDENFTVVSGAEPDPQAYLNAGQRGGTGPNGKPSKTIDQAGLHLIGGEPGWSAALGVAYAVSYAFRSTAPSAMPSDTGGFSRFTAVQIAQAELAMQGWSDVANITFVRVGSGTGAEAYSNDASILLANYATGRAGAAAFASYPGDPAFGSASGDVWINSTLSYNRNPAQGNYGGLVLVHELGHAIGLAHPGDYDADDDVEITYAAHAEYYEDSLQYTVMSYFDESDTGAAFNSVYSAAPLLDDIAAAQKEYGVNTSTRAGDTVYGFNATADRPWFVAAGANAKLVFAAWDAGGADTFDFSGFNGAQTIDLREGYFSNVGGLIGNVAVAKGAAIENAVGGSGADAITGNALPNRLVGGTGADALDGGQGDDMLLGGVGDDRLDGGAGFDTASYASSLAGLVIDLGLTGPRDTGEGRDTLIGVESLIGSNLDDVLLGDAAGNGFDGGEGQDWLVSLDGPDSLVGGGGHDSLWGGASDDLLVGGPGDDVIDGGAGSDTVSYASAASGVIVDLTQIEDQLTRGGGVDTLISIENIVGSGQADVLIGNAGANVLTGGLGDDVFVFTPGSGVDRIADFGAGGGHDWLSLANYGGTGIARSIAQVAADTVVTFSNGDVITLVGFDHSHLQVSGDDLLAI